MPKQNRPVVRGGRIQSAPKRTDRSYLKPSSAPTAPPAAPEEGTSAEVDAQTTFTAPASPAPAAAAAPAARSLPAAARAIQQQGQRRRGVDVAELAKADTQYAYHELRRIAVLTTLVIVTLVVLAIVLR